MIDRREVMEFAREFGLRPDVIEKDYLLGWVLAGIASHPETGTQWAFKGGTCLKKCYFETYRFSEDLDFTLTAPAHLDQAFLVEAFLGIADWIYEAAGIELPKDTLRFDIYQNRRGGTSAEGRIGYRGPLQRRGDPARIKLDLTTDELLLLPPVAREVHHPYSDRPEKGITTLCYCFEELFAEKIRALAERERPRDLYDVVQLYWHEGLRPDRDLLVNTLARKCAFKGMAVPTLETLTSNPKRAELESEWANMLAHQLPALPPFAHFWNDLPELFQWLQGTAERATRSTIRVPVEAVDITWRPPAMAHAWHTATPLEVIRFAAANRLCVDLAYQGSHRLIEPYALRRTRDGNLVLSAVKHATGDIRSYRVDRVQSAVATTESFIPRYAIELNPAIPVAAAATPRFISPISHSKRPISPPTGSRKQTSVGPKYLFRCSRCGRQFSRRSYDASLKPHKNTYGQPCPGRIGTYVKTQ